MPAPKGNQYYLLRTKDGVDKQHTLESLAKGANEYFEYCLNNPLEELDYRGKDANPVKIPRMRAFTKHGLCNWLDITTRTFDNYSKDKDFIHICTRIKQIIYTQKFEGAAAGFLNHSIIARDLGLIDKKELNKVKIKVTNKKDE